MKTKAVKANTMLKTKEAAALIGVPLSTLFAWIKTGRIEAQAFHRSKTSTYRIEQAEAERVKATLPP